MSAYMYTGSCLQCQVQFHSQLSQPCSFHASSSSVVGRRPSVVAMAVVVDGWSSTLFRNRVTEHSGYQQTAVCGQSRCLFGLTTGYAPANQCSWSSTTGPLSPREWWAWGMEAPIRRQGGHGFFLSFMLTMEKQLCWSTACVHGKVAREPWADNAIVLCE